MVGQVGLLLLAADTPAGTDLPLVLALGTIGQRNRQRSRQRSRQR